MAKKETKTGKELERRVADAYRAMGAWEVEHDKEMAGNQIDVYVELETPGHLLHRTAVEAKVPGTLEVPGTSKALSLAREALSIADRCEYRLKQADCHNFLAQLALEEGNLAKAREHAQTARERAECDGPPHRYEVAFQLAEQLLGEIEARA